MGNEEKGKKMKRLFWTWDHSTNWIDNVPGSQEMGVANLYGKDPDWFMTDYETAIDWAAEHGIDAIGVVGLLRERHRGVDGARRICAYAREKGLRIYLIAGVYAYGGVFYEPYRKDDPHSLEVFLRDNPDCMALDKAGKPLYRQFKIPGGHKRDAQGCPSNPKLRQFVLDCVDWVFKAIPELGGVQMETGDVGTCQCERCRARRGGRPAGSISLEDMAGIYPAIGEIVRARSSDAWVICETYHHFLDDACAAFDPAKNPSKDLANLLSMPADTFFQWKCDRRLRGVKGQSWPKGSRVPASLARFRHIMRAHTGTQWWGGRDSFEPELIRRQCELSADAGLTAVSMFGETSPHRANAEFNYLALDYFATDPSRTMDGFVRDVMAPRLGGETAAGRYAELAVLKDEPRKIPAALDEIARIVAGISDYRALSRWFFLADYLGIRRWEAEQRAKERQGGSNDAKAIEDLI